MAVRILVVDDSGFFRRRVTEMLESDSRLEVIGSANNGREAVDQVAKLRPDVVTMDIEMPEMDGITATRRLMATTPVPIIMFSSLTTEGAKATLDALDAGALDFLPKRFEDISSDRDEARKLLCNSVFALSKMPVRKIIPVPHKKVAPKPEVSEKESTIKKPVTRPVSTSTSSDIKLLAIGTSTGGPVALQEVLTGIPGSIPVPIIIVQHMPGTFTPAFAKRLDGQCEIGVKEAEDGDVLQPAMAYLAPGGKQMHVVKRGSSSVIKIVEPEQGQTYKPSIDITFNSIAQVYPKETLAVILTGMGADGREGARTLKQGGSIIWSQDEKSCVVYGMPAAVKEAGLSDKVLSLADIGPGIAKRV